MIGLLCTPVAGFFADKYVILPLCSLLAVIKPLLADLLRMSVADSSCVDLLDITIDMVIEFI